MDDQSHVLCIRPLAREGARFQEKQWRERIERIRSDLLCDLPSLQSLTASTLHQEIDISDSGVNLIFVLKATGQSSLPLHPGRRAPIDAFSSDLERILNDQIHLRERYEHALKTQDIQHLDDHIVALRQRLHAERAKGELTLYSSAEGESFTFDPPPRVLPKSPVFWIDATVTDLNSQTVRVEPLWQNHPDDLGTLIGNKHWLDLRRSGQVQGLSAGLSLTTALELRQILHMQIAAEVLWVDASTKSFSLIEFKQQPGSDSNIGSSKRGGITDAACAELHLPH